MAIDQIDLLEFRHNVTAHLYHAADTFVLAASNIDGLDVACGLLGVAVFLGAYEWHRRWVKGKGYRMAVEQERRRINELLSEGITDMILDWEVNGKISNQQGDKLYADLGRKLELPDLIPTKRRAKIIKNEIKARRKSTEPSAVIARQKVVIPGGKPEPIVRKKFRQTAGGLFKKIWKTT